MRVAPWILVCAATCVGFTALAGPKPEKPAPKSFKPPVKLAASAKSSKAIAPFDQPALGVLTGLVVAELFTSQLSAFKQSAKTRASAVALVHDVLTATDGQAQALLKKPSTKKIDSAGVGEIKKQLEQAQAQLKALKLKPSKRAALKLHKTVQSALAKAGKVAARIDSRAQVKARVAALNALIGEDGLIGANGLIGEDGLQPAAKQSGVVALVGEDGLIGAKGLIGEEGLVGSISKLSASVGKLNGSAGQLSGAGKQLSSALHSKLGTTHKASFSQLRQRNMVLLEQLKSL